MRLRGFAICVAMAAGLLSGRPAVADDVPLSAAARASWQACAAKLGVDAAQPVRARQIGETPEMVGRILAVILAGEKTGTTTTSWVTDRAPETTPVIGGYSVLLDAAGAPAAVLRTTRVTMLRYRDVTEADIQHEGPTVRTLPAWHAVHQRFFTRMLTPYGLKPTEDMPVTLELFEIACR